MRRGFSIVIMYNSFDFIRVYVQNCAYMLICYFSHMQKGSFLIIHNFFARI